MFSAFKLQPFHLLVVFAFNEEGFQEVDGQIQDDEEHQRVASSQLSLIFLANRAPTNWKSWNAIFLKDWVHLNESNFPYSLTYSHTNVVLWMSRHWELGSL